MKTLVARALASRVKSGETIGLGSGSTVELAIDQIGQRIAREGIQVFGVPTSYRVALIAAEQGIQVLSSITATELSWAFDGADEVDGALNMIKGRGAAMLNEKILARRAKNLVIIVSDDKIVEKLGTRHPIPVEVVPEAFYLVQKGLKDLGAREVQIRNSSEKYGPLVTEHNHLILDASFDDIQPALEQQIKSLTGVVESGLFINTRGIAGATSPLVSELLVARKDAVYSVKLVKGKLVESKLELAL